MKTIFIIPMLLFIFSFMMVEVMPRVNILNTPKKFLCGQARRRNRRKNS